jgi:malonyl CoA-acyl carrier protein transacylase
MVSGRSRGRVAVVGQDGGHALRLVKLRATSMEAAYPTELGARRTQRLPVSVPSHCPLLSPVAAQLVATLEDIEVKAPKTVYVGSRRARALIRRRGRARGTGNQRQPPRPMVRLDPAPL